MPDSVVNDINPSQDDCFQYKNLPEDLGRAIGKNYLSSKDLYNLAFTCRGMYNLFKPVLDTRKFLLHIVRGQLTAAQAMLKQDINLLFKKEKVTDYSGRIFININAFQYVLWALDKHAWSMMLNCMPDGEEGKKIAASLLIEYAEFEDKKITYVLENNRINEKHYDFALIHELEKQTDYLSIPPDQIDNWEEINLQWRHGVGGAQMRLPMHIVYEYGGEGLFRFKRRFDLKPDEIQKFYDRENNKYKNWFGHVNESDKRQLGVDFAIYRLNECHPVLYSGPTKEFWHYPGQDLDALEALRKARLAEFVNLKQQLITYMSATHERLAMRF